MTNTRHPSSESDFSLDPDRTVAVIGMAGRFPGARDVSQFWDNLRAGAEGIRRLSDEELLAAGVSPSRLADPRYVKANGILEGMEMFDASFFGMSPRDAAVMDPQTRHFLECVWHALEDAAYVPDDFAGNIGVFAGAGAPQYFWKNVLPDPELRGSVGYFLLRHTGNDKDFLATRASYEFDLTGPSVGIQTACSTSLVAIHYACQSLLSWECDMALAGGVTIEQPHLTGYLYEEGEILSPDGHCRSFDKASNGTVFGSGVGVVVLRRLSDALADGDNIRAVVRGTAVNNDGSRKVSYLAPSVDGQAKAIAEALSLADVDPASLGLVEGHGTGTPVGDPIEVAALTQVFRERTPDTGFCALGSVKSNIGHLDTAAGVASFIKAVRAVESGEIPGTLHFEEPNPRLELDLSPFYVNSRCQPWPETLRPRRAGVSSLGVGGTNAHVILEEPPEAAPTSDGRALHLLTLSARSQEALADASGRLVEFLEKSNGPALADVSYTLRVGRRRFSHRRAVVCRSREDAIEALVTGQATSMTTQATDHDRREVVFLFAGGGAQYPNMGRALYESEDVFRGVVDRCASHLRTVADFDLLRLLFPEEGGEDDAATALRMPSRALPALFTIQLAQAELWKSWGVVPSATIGHSMGEYTAACLAGVLTPDDALSLVHQRGRLFEDVEQGAMLSVQLAREPLQAMLPASVSVAAVNAPEVTVVSGPVEDIDRLERSLTGSGVDCSRIRIDVAAHSGMLDPILPRFRDYLDSIALSPPSGIVISNLTGRRGGDEMASPDYWVRHLRETVRFADGLSEVMDPEGPVLLEVGPGRTLATLARMHPAWSAEQPALHSLPHPDEEDDAQAFQMATLGALWVHGVEIDWTGFDGVGERRRVSLPGYPFQQQPYFVAPPAGADAGVEGAETASSRLEDVSKWFQRMGWRPTVPTQTPDEPMDDRVLLLADAGSAGRGLGRELEESGCDVVSVERGTTFEARGDVTYAIRPGHRPDWIALLGVLKDRGFEPSLIVHTWCLGDTSDDTQEEAFFAPLWLTQALEEVLPGCKTRFVAVTSGAIQVVGGEPLRPHRALLQGPVRVTSRELPSMETCLIDLGAVPSDAPREATPLRRVVHELRRGTEDRIVALRGSERLVERPEPFHLPAAAVGEGIRDEGVYMITGGLGGIGLVVARELVEHSRARVVLLSRNGLPAEDAWDEWLASHESADKTSHAIREVRRLRRLGGDVLVLAADVTDPARVTEAIASTLDRFGRLDGVFHAAGVLDDGPLLTRTRDRARAVLDPKVAGASALVSALEGQELDFLILFSSVSAVTGIAGQIDYAAANAFLDALARDRSGRESYRIVSIGWSAWRDVGMAAELAGETLYGCVGSDELFREVDHPLFDGTADFPDGARAARTRTAVGRWWMIDEHRLREGDYLLPGSGYVELIRSAHALLTEEPDFVVEDLVFRKPFRLTRTEDRELEIKLTPQRGEWRVAVSGRKVGGGSWDEHATAIIRAPGPERTSPAQLTDVIARIGEPDDSVDWEHPFMDFGPRWRNMVGSAALNGEALLQHELPASFHADLDELFLHPALLDMATAGAQHLFYGPDAATSFLVPAGYGSLVMRRPLEPAITSHVRVTAMDRASGLASFDVTIFDSQGRVAVEVQDFSMIGVAGHDLSEDDDDGASWLRDSIRPDEGRDAIRRILSAPVAPHLFVSTYPITTLIEEAAKTSLEAPRAAARPRLPIRGPIPEVIEALESHEAVREAVALGNLDPAQEPRIVAFVVYEPGMLVTVSELRRFVRKVVGPERTPQNFAEMMELPRAEDGTVLQEELRDPFAAGEDFVAPRSETETRVAQIWSELLGLERVGIHDNFLDVGGHSLVGIRVLARIHEATGVRLEANTLTLQTLEQLSAEIDRSGAEQIAST